VVKKIIVGSENYAKYINAELLVIKIGGTYIYHRSLKCEITEAESSFKQFDSYLPIHTLSVDQ
jgi:hypothetical protein